MDLSEKHCIPCANGVEPLSPDKAQEMAAHLPGWSISGDGRWLVRHYTFANFVDALAFVNRVAAVAEAEQHHPDLSLGWGYVHVRLQTHAAGGLHENDFILASRIEKL